MKHLEHTDATRLGIHRLHHRRVSPGRKVEEQRRAFGSGKVFDVLGEAFTGTPLRDLLLLRIEALPQQSLWVLKVAAVGGTGVSHQLPR